MKAKDKLPLIGWREWVSLPELGIEKIKAKLDTGARSSSLHAFNLEYFRRRGRDYVRFDIHPVQRSKSNIVQTHALLLEERSVRSSSGSASDRPVIVTTVEFLDESWPIELTLANRDDMGFRMLLGRQALRSRYLVNPGKSYYGGRPLRKAKQRVVSKSKRKKH